jgi:hypothetical protein
LAKLKSARNVNEDEIAIQSAIHNGILNVDEIIATKKLDLVSSAINTYPIHFVEVLIDWYTNDQWRTMFEYAVDNNIKHTPRNSAGYSMLAQYIVNFDKKKIEEYILSYWNGTSSGTCINKSHLYFYEKGQKRRNEAVSVSIETASDFYPIEAIYQPLLPDPLVSASLSLML